MGDKHDHRPLRLCGEAIGEFGVQLIKGTAKEFVRNSLIACYRPKICSGTFSMRCRSFKIAASCDLDLAEGVGLSAAACTCTRQLQSPRSQNEGASPLQCHTFRMLCRANVEARGRSWTPSGCGVARMWKIAKGVRQPQATASLKDRGRSPGIKRNPSTLIKESDLYAKKVAGTRL